MRAIVVGGAGAMGRVVARDLARSAGVETVTVADLDGERAVQVAEETAASAFGEVRGVAANVASSRFAEALEGHDVCIASVAYRLNPLIAEACLAAGCAYVDLGGLFHVARQTLLYTGRFREAGLTGVTCMGGSPGLTNLLAVMGARELDSVRAIHVRLGSLDPSVEGVPLPIPYSLDTLLDEFSVPAMAYRTGRFEEVEPLGEPEEVDFPAPIGRRTAFTTLHSEVATLPRAFRDVEEVTFKIAFEPGFVERFKLLAAVGLASTEPIQVGRELVRPRDVLIALSRRLPQPAGVEDIDCLRVVLEGEREGRRATVVTESVVEPDREAGLGGGARDTGIPPSIVAQMIAAGEVRGPGMFAPEEAVDPDRFFERLAEREIGYTVTAR
jgi:saccharopine dehydrogenase-like NADP-dependent oxidoreductase